MVTIYMNSFLYPGDFHAMNFLKRLDEHSKDLYNISTVFADMVDFLKEENIEIKEVSGLPFGGSFKVCESDAQKLLDRGLIVNYSSENLETDIGPEDMPIFYIDDKLDQIFKNKNSLMNTPIVNLSLPNFANSDRASSIEDSKQVDIDLGKMLQKFPSLSSFISICTESIDRDTWTFNIGIADLGYRISNVDFDRLKGCFTFSCEDSNDLHLHKSDLKSIYTSLSTSISLLSNIVAYSDNKEFAIAFDYICRDLRVLKHLIQLDYAVGN